jgi:hypothetical protein
MGKDVADVAFLGQEVRDKRRKIRRHSEHKGVRRRGANVDKTAQAKRKNGRDEHVSL